MSETSSSQKEPGPLASSKWMLEEIERLRATIARLKTRQAALRQTDTVVLLQSHLAKSLETVATERRRVSDLEKELAEIRSTRDSASFEKSESRTASPSSKESRSVADLEKEIQELRVENARMVELERENLDLQEQLGVLEELRVQASKVKALQQREAQYEAARQEAETLRKDLAENKSLLQNRESQISGLENRINELEKLLEDTQARLDQSEDELKERQRALDVSRFHDFEQNLEKLQHRILDEESLNAPETAEGAPEGSALRFSEEEVNQRLARKVQAVEYVTWNSIVAFMNEHLDIKKLRLRDSRTKPGITEIHSQGKLDPTPCLEAIADADAWNDADLQDDELVIAYDRQRKLFTVQPSSENAPARLSSLRMVVNFLNYTGIQHGQSALYDMTRKHFSEDEPGFRLFRREELVRAGNPHQDEMEWIHEDFLQGRLVRNRMLFRAVTHAGAEEDI